MDGKYVTSDKNDKSYEQDDKHKIRYQKVQALQQLAMEEFLISIVKENDWMLPLCYIRSIKSLYYLDIQSEKG